MKFYSYIAFFFFINNTWARFIIDVKSRCYTCKINEIRRARGTRSKLASCIPAKQASALLRELRVCMSQLRASNPFTASLGIFVAFRWIQVLVLSRLSTIMNHSLTVKK